MHHTPTPRLSAVVLLHHHWPAADVVVSVSRKTDASLWPALFSAVGSPSAVLELLLDSGSLTSAACFLIVVDRWVDVFVCACVRACVCRQTG